MVLTSYARFKGLVKKDNSEVRHNLSSLGYVCVPELCVCVCVSRSTMTLDVVCAMWPQQWEEVNGLEKLEVGCGYRTENSIPIRRLSRDELLIGGKIRMLLESLPPGCASPARGKYLATLVRASTPLWHTPCATASDGTAAQELTTTRWDSSLCARTHAEGLL